MNNILNTQSFEKNKNEAKIITPKMADKKIPATNFATAAKLNLLDIINLMNIYIKRKRVDWQSNGRKQAAKLIYILNVKIIFFKLFL